MSDAHSAVRRGGQDVIGGFIACGHRGALTRLPCVTARAPVGQPVMFVGTVVLPFGNGQMSGPPRAGNGGGSGSDPRSPQAKDCARVTQRVGVLLPWQRQSSPT